MRYLGGIPVKRGASSNQVATLADAITTSTRDCMLVIPPEGKRAMVTSWHMGFYHIAVTANVPVVFAYMDYQKKETGIGGTFIPTGDIEKDMAVIRQFYRHIKGKYPENFYV